MDNLLIGCIMRDPSAQREGIIVRCCAKSTGNYVWILLKNGEIKSWDIDRAVVMDKDVKRIFRDGPKIMKKKLSRFEMMDL